MAPIPFADSPSPSITTLCLGPKKVFSKVSMKKKADVSLEVAWVFLVLFRYLSTFCHNKSTLERCFKTSPSKDSMKGQYRCWCWCLAVMSMISLIGKAQQTYSRAFPSYDLAPKWQLLPFPSGFHLREFGEMLEMLRWRYEMLKFSPFNQTAHLFYNWLKFQLSPKTRWNCVFFIQDEWWKCDAPSVHDSCGAAFGGLSDGYANEVFKGGVWDANETW